MHCTQSEFEHNGYTPEHNLLLFPQTQIFEEEPYVRKKKEIHLSELRTQWDESVQLTHFPSGEHFGSCEYNCKQSLFLMHSLQELLKQYCVGVVHFFPNVLH